MARRREVFAGMTARELRGALLELQGMRLAADAMREQLEEIRQALYRRIDYNLAWLLQEGAHAHAQANNVREAPSQQSSRSQHKTERECDRWQIATLRKIIAFASPEGTDLEAHEYDVARWAEHPNTLGHLEAQERLFAARATQVRREFFGPRARCPLCGETPQQDSSGYAWPEGLSRHLEGRGNVGRCSVIDFAFTECRRARRQAWTTRDKEVGPATCHPDVPSYEYGEGECRSCHEAAWKSWHESIDGEVREWRRGSASKVAIRGPRTSACVATLLGVERIISTDSGVAMRYLAKIIHCRPRFRLRSTSDVGKTEFTLLATGN